MLILGQGYCGARLAARLKREGWRVTATRRRAQDDSIAFDDSAAVRAAIAGASHILSSVPPEAEGDPVLDRYGAAIAASPARWAGYLSSSGVYGDTGGAWVDESAPIGTGRRSARAAADRGWQALRPDMRIFRLPGIYGPGRSAIERVRDGRAHRVHAPGQVFSRVHVDDIVGGVLASFDGMPGIYNLADDMPCDQNRVIEGACDILGVSYPLMSPLDDSVMSPMARAFYQENRRVSNMKAKRLLGWAPRYRTWREGLIACL